MGVNTIINLSPGTRLRDVAEVISLLVGNPASWRKPDYPNRYDYYDVTGAKTKSTIVPEMVHIIVDTKKAVLFQQCPALAKQFDGGIWWSYHFESDHHPGPQLYPDCTALAIAVGRRLVDIFGGSVVYNDAEDSKPLYRSAYKPMRGGSDKAFDEWQKLLSKIAPLRIEDVLRYEPRAAYPMVKP